MSLFGGKKEEHFDGILGVDLGPSGVKIVELQQEKGRMRLSTYGYSEFAVQTAEPFAFLENPDKAVAAIKQIIKDSGMRATRAIAALPSGSVFQAIVTIPIPKDDKDDLKRLIETQAAKLLPMPLSEMILDSNVLDKELLPKSGKVEKSKVESGPEGDDASRGVLHTPSDIVDEKQKHIRVLITGAPKVLVEKYVDLFKKAKIELVSLETEVFALIRSLVGKDKSRIMLVDMGLAQTHITVIDKAIPYLTRNMNGGGAAVTNALATSTGVSFADAERMKRDLGLQGDAKEPPKVIKDALQNVVHELRYALELYAQQTFHDNSTVEKIVLTGGSAHLPGLDPYLTAQLNVNVYVGDPWARIAAPPALRPVLEEVGPRFAVALGLAMRMNES